MGQQHRRGAVAEHIGQTFSRISRIQRHITRAGFEDRQQTDQHFRAPFDANRHPIIRANAQTDQVMGELVGLAVQFGVAQLLAVEDHRDGIRLRFDLGFKQLVDGFVAWVRDVGGVEVNQQTLTLAGIDQFDAVNQHLIIRHHAAQHPFEITEITLHGGFVEQRRGVFEAAEQLPLNLTEFQRQVELGHMVGHAQPFEFQFTEHQIGAARRLPGQHRLEQWAVGETAHRVQHFHHLLERQVLMGLGAKGLGLDPSEQGFNIRRAGDIDTHRQGVDEEADQAFDFGTGAVGHRRTDHHFILPREAAEQQRPTGHQCRVQRGAVALAEVFQGCGQAFIEDQRNCGTRVILLRRTRSIGRQHQQRWRIGQGLLPVKVLGLQHFTAQPAALPQGVVGVLHGQGWQRIFQTVAERFIQRRQFRGQHANRPAIGDDVVHGHQQHMVLGIEPDQSATNQRAVFQVEQFYRFFSRQNLQLRFGIGLSAQILLMQGETAICRSEALQRFFALCLDEGGAQRFVTEHDAVQRPLQGIGVQRATQTQARRHVIRRAATFHLRQEPQTLLGEGQRQVVIAGNRDDLRQGAATGLGHSLRQCGEFRLGEQVGQTQLDTQTQTHLGNQLNCQQRMAAQLKELILTPDLWQAEQVLPDLRQGDFDFADRGFVGVGDDGGSVWGWQRLAVEFAVRGQWQFVQMDVGCRDHIVRQLGLQVTA
ncbi:hypothetical protein FX983_06567 [Pseudomonas frederiksbergensis]|uniref:Uncharacterized protein n=1 Tax=Pseudomonas frederiksbergensis TaxID=104087 RepID=A0A6L5BK29_9PSED|nr:hypothetical protein FX983_06567 [Pseudomonas frederiksbergensis]